MRTFFDREFVLMSLGNSSRQDPTAGSNHVPSVPCIFSMHYAAIDRPMVLDFQTVTAGVPSIVQGGLLWLAA